MSPTFFRFEKRVVLIVIERCLVLKLHVLGGGYSLVMLLEHMAQKIKLLRVWTCRESVDAIHLPMGMDEIDD